MVEIKPIKYRAAVQIDAEHIMAKWERYYLIPVFRGQLTDKVDIRDLGLATFVAEQVNVFLKEDKLPAKEIQGPILNIAEDFIAGRPLVFRAGDYIALQNYRREIGKIK
jgi:hypothetical protein